MPRKEGRILMKEGRKEGRKEEMKDGRKDAKEGRKGTKEGRKDTKEGRKNVKDGYQGRIPRKNTKGRIFSSLSLACFLSFFTLSSLLLFLRHVVLLSWCPSVI